MISVDPEYQRQGIGSMLVQWGCEEADAHGRDSFLISSPAGICLYTKFGFKSVGEVHTSTGTFTSMFREATMEPSQPDAIRMVAEKGDFLIWRRFFIFVFAIFSLFFIYVGSGI